MNHDNAIYTLTANDGFTASFTEKTISENTRILHLTAKSDAPSKLALTLEWKIPDVGINVCYSPIGCTRRNIRPDWGRLCRIVRNVFGSGLLGYRLRRHEPPDNRLLGREEQRQNLSRRPRSL